MLRRHRERGSSLLSATAVLSLAAVGSVGAVVYSAGAIRIQVEEKRAGGQNIRLFVPGIVVPLGMAFIPGEKLQDVAEDAREALPILKAASEELARCPDGVLVEVRERDEHVLIQKLGGALVIDVDSDDEKVHVSVPLHLVLSAVNRLERLTPPEPAGASADPPETGLRGAPL